MSFENWAILISDYEEKAEEYAAVAEWCNESGEYTIIEDGEYYRVVHVEPLPPEPEDESEVEDVSD